MSNAQEVMQEITEISGYIVRSVDRFISGQIISPENYKKLNTVKATANSALKRAQKIWGIITGPYQILLNSARQEIEAEFQSKHNRIQIEHQQRAQQAGNNPQAANVFAQEHNEKVQALQQERNAKLQLKTEELETKHLKIESKELSALLQEFEVILNQLVETEKSIKGEEVTTKAAQSFGSNKESFDNAVSYHKSMATIVLCILISLLVAGASMLYLFFVKWNRPAELPALPSTGALIVALATTLSGKIAFLLVWAWILRHLASLHEVHSEQAVIYNDRSVSLSIAENLLLAAPQLEQKTALLNTLAKGYLDIEKNAFRSANSLRKNDEGSAQLGLVKELVDTVKPLLESLRPNEK